MADISLTFDANTAPFLNGVKEIRASVNTLSQTIKEKREELIQFSANLSMIFHGVKSAAALAGRMLSAPLQEFSRWEDAATRLAPLVGGLEAAKEVASHLRDEAANGTMSLEQLASVAGDRNAGHEQKKSSGAGTPEDFFSYYFFSYFL